MCETEFFVTPTVLSAALFYVFENMLDFSVMTFLEDDIIIVYNIFKEILNYINIKRW